MNKNFTAQENLLNQGNVKRTLQKHEFLTVLRELSSLTKPEVLSL